MKTLNLDALKQATLQTTHFPYAIVPNFIQMDQLDTLCAHFPNVPGPGSYPNNLLSIPPVFQTLIDEMHSDALRAVVAEKFSMNLDGYPTMMTIRGACRARDGSIHPDTRTKLITFLLYMNPTWTHDGGRLRLLKSPDDMDDMITDIPPLAGTLLIFKVSPNSWHGHPPYEGPRKAIQMNYVASEAVIAKESRRHRFSALAKRLKNLVTSR